MPTTRQPNPYRPGFAQHPLLLAGRTAVVAGAREALDVAALDGRMPRPLVLVGVRGVGKTVALNEIAALAGEEYSWPAVHVEVKPRTSFTAELVERLTAAAALLTQGGVGGRGGSAGGRDGARLRVSEAKIKAGVFGVGGEVGFTRPETSGPLGLADSPEAVEAALELAAAAAMESNAGLVLTIDEVHLAARADLAALTAALQRHVPDGWPLVVAVAGLPSLRDARSSVTYLERGEWHELGLLTEGDTLDALAQPALHAGRPVTPSAAHQLAAASGGYPYAIQVMGHHAWRASTGAEVIGVEHVPPALRAAQADLAHGLFAGRWHDASPKEREYLTVLATLLQQNGTVAHADIARALRKEPAKLSYLRARLIQKGTLFADGHSLRFLVPGMATWIANAAS